MVKYIKTEGEIMQKESFSSDLYKSRKYSMSILKANLAALVYPLPFAALYMVAFMAAIQLRSDMTAGFSFSFGGSPAMLLLNMLLYFAGFFLLVVLHEIVHSLFFLRGCEQGRKSIVFGVKYATPYCHCKEVLTASIYRQSLIAPLWAICLPLAVISFVTCNTLIFLITLSMIFGSGGDLAVIWMIRKFPGKKTFVWDMDDEVGCIVYEPILAEGSDSEKIS